MDGQRKDCKLKLELPGREECFIQMDPIHRDTYGEIFHALQIRLVVYEGRLMYIIDGIPEERADYTSITVADDPYEAIALIGSDKLPKADKPANI